MRKRKALNIFVTLLLSFVLLSCFCLDFKFIFNSIEVSADKKAVPTCSGEEENENYGTEELSTNGFQFPYDNYMQAYFDRLTSNFGENVKGSCTYIALSAVLSYYDSFLNDSIIDEAYDMPGRSKLYNTLLAGRSPGTLNDKYYVPQLNQDNEEENGAENYYTFLEEYEEKSLHAKLILIGNRNYNTYDFDDNKYPCGTSFANLIKIANKYLQTERSFKNNEDYSIEYKGNGGSDAIKSFIISQIDAGYPVIVSIGREKRADEEGDGHKYHATVAFAHDDDGNIYLHTGWHSGKRIATLQEAGYEFYDEAFTLKFNLPHTHSYNYWIYPDGDYNSVPEKYCYCDKRIITYNHTEHTYSAACDKKDSNTHIAYCVCGESIEEEHKFDNSYDIGTISGHTAYCKCGEGKVMAHSYTHKHVKIANDENYHKSYCVCGDYNKSSHVWTTYTPQNLLNLLNLNNQDIIEPQVSIGKTYVRCKECNYVCEKKGFVPVIKG